MKKIILGIILMVCISVTTFYFTLQNLQITEINEKEKVVVITILNQNWVYEYN